LPSFEVFLLGCAEDVEFCCVVAKKQWLPEEFPVTGIGQVPRTRSVTASEFAKGAARAFYV
jgi:hypothetical protein